MKNTPTSSTPRRKNLTVTFNLPAAHKTPPATVTFHERTIKYIRVHPLMTVAEIRTTAR